MVVIPFLHDFSCKGTTFFMNCANFLEYNPKIYIILGNTIHKIHAFCGYVYPNQAKLYKLENIDVHIYVCYLSYSILRKHVGIMWTGRGEQNQLEFIIVATN